MEPRTARKRHEPCVPLDDKGYDADFILADLEAKDIAALILAKRNRKVQPVIDELTSYVTNSWNLADGMTAVLHGGTTQIVGFAYDNLGRRTGISRSNGVSSTYGYDGAGRLASLSHDVGGTARGHHLHLRLQPRQPDSVTTFLTPMGADQGYRAMKRTGVLAFLALLGTLLVISSGGNRESWGSIALYSSGALLYSFSVGAFCISVSGWRKKSGALTVETYTVVVFIVSQLGAMLSVVRGVSDEHLSEFLKFVPWFCYFALVSLTAATLSGTSASRFRVAVIGLQLLFFPFFAFSLERERARRTALFDGPR
ncbi:RHS repeat domain-containing protein [Brevundimonas naejangsanensis]|uniref:RHS repeat domain-containing protein n=1 Tax=Brevundimonas naejangsanensis TaxID=588932 RepID=UPI003D00A9F3